LHKQIIDMGFLDSVEKSSGALFFDDSVVTKAKTPRSRFIAGRISDWQRAKKVGSPDVQPNHGWRHRFKTLARELGLDPRVVDTIQGHATRTASDDYGDVTIKARKRAIDMMPSYDVK
jgi:integrase